MATPLKLNTGGSPTGPKLSLRTPGAAGATPRVRLKGANGQPIAPKTAAPASPKTAAPANPKTAAPAAAAEAEAAKAAEAAAAAKAAEEAAAAKAAEEAAAAKAAEEAAAAQAAAEAEAARLAQEEYERQMEEYNRQMEEYNRQMAEFKAAEEAAAAQQAEAEALAAAAEAQKLTAGNTDAEEAKAKLRAATKPAVAKPAAKPAGAKPGLSVAKPKGAAKPTAAALGGAKTAKPAAKKSTPAPTAPAAGADAAAVPVDGISEEELAARDAYLNQLQADAGRVPIWRTVPFMVGCGVLLVFAGGCAYYVVQDQAKKERVEAHRKYIKKLLLRAQEINQKGVETVANAKAKGVDITCSRKDAKALLEVVVDPFVKGETGQPLYGNAPEGVAQNACLLLGLAAEQDEEICKVVFDTLGKKCDKIKPSLFKWQLQRLAVSDTKDLNAKFRKLAAAVNEKPDWNKKTEILSYIWECMGLRVTEKDVPEILALLADEKTDGRLTNNLSICLDNILEMMDDADKKAKIGDEIFTKLSEKNRRNMAPTLAKCCSPKALEFYKNELKDRKTWKRGAGLTFISYWGNDDILDYVMELKEIAKDDESDSRQVNEVIGTVFRQNRDRSDAEAQKLLDIYFGNAFVDTTNLQDIINKTDPDSTLFVGEGPELEKLKEERKTLEAAHGEKMRLIKAMTVLRDYKWVTNILSKLESDKDEDVALAAKKAQETVKKNTVEAAAARDQYKTREK